MTSKYQTLEGFLFSPFHKTESHKQKDLDYDTKYRSYINENKISIAGMCEIEDSVFIHVKVPSESQNNYSYDVIIRFFSTDPLIINQNHLRNYYIQFFSNSPSFMYQYAYVYNQEGFLIEALYDKLDPDYIDKPPEKANASMTLSYDKSIYFACRYLSDNKFRYLDKNGVITRKKKPSNKFFRDISDFKSVKFDQYVLAEEKKLSKQLEKKSPHQKDKSSSRDRNATKKNASKSTSQVSSITIVKKKGGKSKIVSGGRKAAVRSTKK